MPCGVICFFKQKSAYEMRISDWSSDVCSSDLVEFKCGSGPFFDNILEFRIFQRIDAATGLEHADMAGMAPLIFADIIPHGLFAVAVVDEDGDASHVRHFLRGIEIGRASCRERVCQDMYISVVAVSLKKNKYRKDTVNNIYIKYHQNK